MTFILAASGKKQSGKDTLLRGIRPFLDTYGKVKYYSFADELKNFLQTGLGLKYDQVWGSDEDKNSPTDFVWENLPLFIRWERGGCFCLTKSNCQIKISVSNQIRSSCEMEQYFLDIIESGLKPTCFKTGRMSSRELMQIVGTDVMRRMFSDKIWVNALFRAIEKDNPNVALIPDMRFPSEFFPLYEKGACIIRLTRDVTKGDSHASEVSLDDWPWEKYERVLVIPQDATIVSSQEMTLDWLSKQISKGNDNE